MSDLSEDVDIVPPHRQWWHSFWLAALAIVLMLGGIAFAVALILWALLPSLG
jgi:hypothetical protein